MLRMISCTSSPLGSEMRLRSLSAYNVAGLLHKCRRLILRQPAPAQCHRRESEAFAAL